MQQGTGSDNLVIWFTDTVPGTPKASQTLEALAVMDEWLGNMRRNPKGGIAGNKPGGRGRLLRPDGQPIAAGASVWDGILDAAWASAPPASRCTAPRASWQVRPSRAASTAAH
jgi:hypothetical protein